jgi:hypothetical protein
MTLGAKPVGAKPGGREAGGRRGGGEGCLGEAARHHGVGQPHHFEGAGAMVAPAQEAAFLQRRDQPVDARLRPELQRLLHFLEARREAGALEVPVDEDQQLVLLACQHAGTPGRCTTAGAARQRSVVRPILLRKRQNKPATDPMFYISSGRRVKRRTVKSP